MRISLKVDGQNKTFTADFIPGRVYRRAIEIHSEIDFRNMNPEVLDKMVDFVVEAYGSQFTRDQFYDGVDARKLIDTIVSTINAIIGDASEALGVDVSDPNSRQRA
jgi:hypothetical protein